MEDDERDDSRDRVVWLGAWLDGHFDQVVTALSAVEQEFRKVETSDVNSEVIRKMAEEQAREWRRLREEVTRLYG